MRRVILAIVGTAAGLVALLSFKSHTSAALTTPPAAISDQTSPATEPAATPSASGSGSATSAGSASSAGSSAASSGAAVAKTVTGDAADTQYGPVQVQITVKNGKIIAAQAVEYPQGSQRDEEINSYAIPVLNKETVAASSSGKDSIDAVSGASYTSNGYMTSLQSALDKAGL
jgi:uncharacterized protein with FMN-binding domain